MKVSESESDVYRQTSKFYAQANTLLRNFHYCSDDVKCMLFRSFCTNMYCSPLWFNSTSSNIKKLKTSYNGALRRLLLIKNHIALALCLEHMEFLLSLNCCANIFIIFLIKLV